MKLRDSMYEPIRMCTGDGKKKKTEKGNGARIRIKKIWNEREYWGQAKQMKKTKIIRVFLIEIDVKLKNCVKMQPMSNNTDRNHHAQTYNVCTQSLGDKC